MPDSKIVFDLDFLRCKAEMAKKAFPGVPGKPGTVINPDTLLALVSEVERLRAALGEGTPRCSVPYHCPCGCGSHMGCFFEEATDD